MSVHAPYVGHYFLLAGAINEQRGSGSDYPAWVRPFIILVVILTWMTLNIASAIVGRNLVPAYVHVAMLMLVASLFRVEFGNIHIEKNEKDSK